MAVEAWMQLVVKTGDNMFMLSNKYDLVKCFSNC